MDFIIGLLESEGYNIIIIYINRFIKMRHFISTQNNITAQDIALLFINNIYIAHGFPNIIMSDREPQFISLF